MWQHILECTHSDPSCPSAVQIPAPRIKPAFTSFVPFVSTHSATSAMMERQLICPARLLSPPFHFSLGTVLSKSWRSLLSAESVGLKAAVSCPPFPTIGLSLSRCGLQPYLPAPQSSCGCVPQSTRSTSFPIISLPRRRRRNIAETCPQFRTERQRVAQSHWDCKRLRQKVVLCIWQQTCAFQDIWLHYAGVYLM